VNPAVAALRQAAGFVLPVDCSFDSTTGASSAFIFRPYPNSARQRNKALLASLCAPATAETLFPGCSHSSTKASFSSLVKLRRMARPSRVEQAAVASVTTNSRVNDQKMRDEQGRMNKRMLRLLGLDPKVCQKTIRETLARSSCSRAGESQGSRPTTPPSSEGSALARRGKCLVRAARRGQ
jgi:hypothetical protein